MLQHRPVPAPPSRWARQPPLPRSGRERTPDVAGGPGSLRKRRSGFAPQDGLKGSSSVGDSGDKVDENTEAVIYLHPSMEIPEASVVATYNTKTRHLVTVMTVMIHSMRA